MCLGAAVLSKHQPLLGDGVVTYTQNVSNRYKGYLLTIRCCMHGYV